MAKQHDKKEDEVEETVSQENENTDAPEEKEQEKPARIKHQYTNTSSTKVELSNGVKSISIPSGETISIPTELLLLAQAHPSLVQ